MPYHVYVPWITEYLKQKNSVSVLEIGVDVGQTMIPIVHNMVVHKKPFRYVGLDIRLDVNLAAMLRSFQVYDNQHIEYREANSLEWLPECKEQFDVVLIDGDHNYHTVSTELSHIDSILKPDGVCICDDYVGKWAERDLFYADRKSHADIDIATKAVETDKHGVRTAIDEFVRDHPDWKTTSVTHSEAIVLLRRDTAMQLGL